MSNNTQKLINLAFSDSAFEGEAINAFLAIRRDKQACQEIKRGTVIYKEKIVERVKVVKVNNHSRVATVKKKIKWGKLSFFLNLLYENEMRIPKHKVKILKEPSVFDWKWHVEVSLYGRDDNELVNLNSELKNIIKESNGY